MGLLGQAQLAVLGFCGDSGRIRIPDPVFEIISGSNPVFKIMSDSDPVVNWDLVLQIWYKPAPVRTSRFIIHLKLDFSSSIYLLK